MDLKAELQRIKDEAKEAARVTKEATAAVEITSYEHGMKDTENKLVEEVAGVCREYYAETCVEALNNAGVPANSKLRKAENIFFPEHMQEIPVELPPTALPLPSPKQVLNLQNPTLDAGTSIGADKGKETLSSTKDTPPEDVLPKLKKLNLSPRQGVLSLRQLTPRRALNQQRSSCRIFFFFFFFFIFMLFPFCCGFCHSLLCTFLLINE